MATNGYLVSNEFPRYFVNVPNMPQDVFTNPRVYEVSNSNINPPTSTTQSINVDVSNLTEVESGSQIGSVIAVTASILIICAFAAAIGIPFAAAPHKTTTTTTTTTTSTATTTTTTSTTTAGANMTYSGPENSAVSLTCTNSMRLTTVYAFYGDPTCASCACGYCTCSAMTVTSIITAQCTGLTSCSFTAGNSLFGDPCFGVGKTFQLIYFCS